MRILRRLHRNQMFYVLYLLFIEAKPYLKYLILLLCTFSALGQASIPTSNYAGTNALLLNPAEIADNRAKFYINIASAHVDYQNNFSSWKASNGFLKSVLDTRKFPGDYKVAESKTNVNTNFYAAIAGPAIMVSLPNQKLALAAGINVKTYATINKMTPITGGILYKGLFRPSIQSVVHTNERFNFNVASINEYYGSIAFVILDDRERFLKIGATGKRLTNNLLFNIDAQSVDYRVEQVVGNPRRQDIFLPNSNGSFVNANDNFSPSVSWFLGQVASISGIGSGFGGDIGMVYEKRPDHHKYRIKGKKGMVYDPKYNKYQWKIGVSLQDVGYLSYNDPRIQRTAINATNNEIRSGTFTDIESPDAIVRGLEGIYNINTANYSNSLTVLTPASFTIHGDYKIKHNTYISAVWNQNLLGKKRIGPYRASSLLIVPRYESKWFELMVPFAISNDYQNVNVGIIGRAGPLTIGFSDFTLLSPLLDSRGIGVEFSLGIPIGYYEPKGNLKCFYEEKIRWWKKR